MNVLIILTILYISVITFIVWKKDGKKSGILIFIIFAILTLILSGIHLASDKDTKWAINRMNEDIEYLEKDVIRNITYKDKYKIETYKLLDGSLLIQIFNERDEYVNAECFVKFYDNGKEVDAPNFAYIFNIAPHSYGYGLLYDYPGSDNTYKNYSHDEIKVYITPNTYYDKKDYKDNIEYSYNQEEGIIYGVNKSNVDINEMSFNIFYYDDLGKIIDYSNRRIFEKIKPNGEFNIRNYNNSGSIKVILEYALAKDN